ncbi:MAG TPA: squalene synthase HpnC [Alphaproteobacteria bacterium]|nr:squalene synthase HpnC [Alphaproteobacteria bacterium]
MTDTATVQSAEVPPGKGAGDENFPVGSFLLPARLRPHVAVFYAYARAIDDVADNAVLTPGEKIDRLEGFAAAIRGENDDPAYDTARRMRESLLATDITMKHCLDLISAFKQDAVKTRYGNWHELIDYCDRSAAPVGRYLLDLHGEDPADYRYSDALCNALQVINHLQDCQDDYRQLDRVYLPLDWLGEAGGTIEDLDAPGMNAALRTVVDKCLQDCRGLMAEARLLAPHLKSRRLAAESATIVKIALKLIDELSRRDPIAERVELTKPQFLICGVAGTLSALFRRD